MPWVWVSIGSNVDRDNAVRGAVAALRERYGELVLSKVYETTAEGFDGEPFLNLVAGFQTALPADALRRQFRDIEDAFGRVRGGERFAPRTLDLDLLTYGEAVLREEGAVVVPRDEIERYAFVLGPLAEVAGEQRHPLLRRTYAELWRELMPRGGESLSEYSIQLS